MQKIIRFSVLILLLLALVVAVVPIATGCEPGRGFVCSNVGWNSGGTAATTPVQQTAALKLAPDAQPMVGWNG